MGYSDVTFYWNVLHGEAYRYWWEIMTRTPAHGVYNADTRFEAVEYQR